MNATNLEVSKETAYAISFLDNGGDVDNFPKSHKKLYGAIKTEEKRRLMVEIRHLINKSSTFKKIIYKKIKESTKSTIKPEVLYNELGKFTYNQLKLLLQDERNK
jgi:hypothetical protein